MLATRISMFLLIFVLFSNQAHPFEARLEVSPQGGANQISVIIMDPSSPPPAWGDFIGYAVVCYKHFDCSGPIFVSEITEFTEPITITDFSPPAHSAYTYIVLLINEEGITGHSAGWMSVVTLGGLEHPLLRGDLRSGGVFGGGLVYLCPDSCWLHPLMLGVVGLSGQSPAELIEARDTGQVFDIFGTIAYSWEGPYLTLVSEAIPTTCDAQVATQVIDWTRIKAFYR